MVQLKGLIILPYNVCIKFQFLMVQLKVDNSFAVKIYYYKFQFLMVQLKELRTLIPECRLTPFQFLMVQLKVILNLTVFTI